VPTHGGAQDNKSSIALTYRFTSCTVGSPALVACLLATLARLLCRHGFGRSSVDASGTVGAAVEDYPGLALVLQR